MPRWRTLFKVGFWSWLAWRLLGPVLPPRFVGPQETPSRVPGRTVVIGRHEYFVREVGPEDAPPLVLLHGWLYDGLATWHRVWPVLSGTHRVVILDLRAHGKTDRRRGSFDIEDMADDVAAVLDVIGVERAPIVGYSMGGMVAQALARRHPRLVAKLVLGASAAKPIAQPKVLAAAFFGLGRVLARVDRVTMPRLSFHYLTRSGAVPPEHAAWLWEELMDRDTELYHDAAFAILRFDSTEWIGRIEVPVLMIIPTADQMIFARQQYETLELIKDGRVVELMGARHEAVLTHGDDVAKAIASFV